MMTLAKTFGSDKSLQTYQPKNSFYNYAIQQVLTRFKLQKIIKVIKLYKAGAENKYPDEKKNQIFVKKKFEIF
jgi:hypothetical protein